MTAAIETTGLAKRYRRVMALEDCSVTVPDGAICALVGPNGAGKSTLLRILAGLAKPTAGQVSVLGGPPRQHPDFLSAIGYLPQESALYRNMSAADHVKAGARLNKHWDGDLALKLVRDQEIPVDRAVGALSGGQRAQVGLALTLAKRPRLLLLDEPVAALDPLARRRFMGTLTAASADGGLTVLLSSHLVTDLERICDHLILISGSRVRLAGDIDMLLAEHAMLTGPRQDTSALERDHTVVHSTVTERQATLLIRRGEPIVGPEWETSDVSLEELALGYMERGVIAPPAPLTLAGGSQ